MKDMVSNESSDCHDLIQKATNFNNAAIASVMECSDYRSHFNIYEQR